MNNMLQKGLIVKINSDTYTVKVNKDLLNCKSRGKFRNLKIKPLVGDRVLVNPLTLIIEEVLPRDNYLDRPPVSNIDVALIVTSLKMPNINLTLLDKLISMVTMAKIKPVIVFTKTDLANKEELKTLKKLRSYYEKIGIKTFTNKEIRRLKKYLKNKIITTCGQTGAGKSSLINLFDKKLNLKTDEISLSLNRGKHTTRIVELFSLDKFFVVDTPGFSALDLHNYSLEDIKNSFIEFKNCHCEFKDCKHQNEKGCEVIAKVSRGEILPSRYENYIRFIKEVS